MLVLTTWLACAGADPTGPATTAPTAETGATGAGIQRILFVVVDTTRADHVSGFGSARDTAPALAAFAEGGLRYDRAYAHAPWTKPSMATVFSSQLPAEHGLLQWNQRTPEGLPTFATALQAAGWRTEAVVVQEAFLPEDNAFHVGFDRFDTSVFEGIGDPQVLVTSETLTDRALGVLGELAAEERPWLLWVHYFDPHIVYADHQAPVDFGSEDADRYDEEIAFFDLHLGRLLSAVGDDVLVVLLSDHGEELLDHGGRGHTRTVYEELVRVPLVLRGPGIPVGVEPRPVGLVDLGPTLLSLAGVPLPETFRGRPLLPAPEVRPIPMETRRWGDVRGVLDGDWKGIWDLRTGAGELYHLPSDPTERTNRWDSDPAERDRLLGLLRESWPEIP